MGLKYTLSESDLIKIKENYGKIPNVELLKLLDNDCSRGILIYTAKQLGIRKTRDVLVKIQLSDTYEKLIDILSIIENRKAQSLENAAELGGLHVSTFLKSIKKYPKLLNRYQNIKWNDVFNLRCSICEDKLTEDNYRRIHNITCSRGANKNRFRKCDRCHKQSMRVIDTLDKKIGLIFSSAQSRAKVKNIDFSLTKHDILSLWNKQQGKCFYTYENMTHDTGSNSMVSIDRLDSSKGYSIGNVCLTIWEVNRMKNNIDFDRFITICRNITSNLARY
jgi:hypothetical protein